MNIAQKIGVVAGLALCAIAHAANTTVVTLNIPAQRMQDALNALAEQAGLQVVFAVPAVKGRTSPKVEGTYTPEAALKLLLAGTQLSYEFINEKVIAIRSPTEGVSTSDASGGAGGSLQLAQVESAVTSQADAARKAVEDRTTDEIVVIGTNIRGVYPASSPVQVYTAEDIARTGAITTEQFIQKLPQNLGTRTEYASTATGVTRNYEGVNTVDLRGLGVGTTLTLLNGRRLALANSGQAADVSMIPASALARVEVLTDGASAIYGSDAVGGVVNFVLREDFDGAETRLGYGGVTDGDLRQWSFTQTFGRAWNSGHGLLSFDVSDASPLAAADRSFAASSIWGPGNLTPDSRRYSGLATVSQGYGDRLSVDGAFAFSRRDVEMKAYTSSVFLTNRPLVSETAQYFADLGASYLISDALQASVAATYTKVDVDTTWTAIGATPAQGYDTKHSALDITATLDGKLFPLPAGPVRFVLGADYLAEQYRGERQANTTSLSGTDLGRITTAFFGELHVPLIAPAQDIKLVRRLELSLAARHTGYDDDSRPALARDFGDRVSPKAGLLWSPVEALNLRATYGESFRAPSLSQVDPASSEVRLQGPLPINGIQSTGLFLSGPSARIDAETADSFTLGFDFSARQSGFRVSGTYFNIEYTDRIATVGLAPVTANPSAWPEVIWQPSSVAEVAALLASAPVTTNTTGINLNSPTAAAAVFAIPNLWVLENRTRNLSVSQVDGFDLSIGQRFDVPLGAISLGTQLTRILDYLEQASPSSPLLVVVDTVLRPVSFRGRLYAGFARGGFDSTVNVNYVDSYDNPLAAVDAPRRVGSWTTVDWATTYDFGRDSPRNFLNGVKLSFSVQNLLDADPPFVARTTGGNPSLSNSPAFDPANANPLGRVVNLAITRQW